MMWLPVLMTFSTLPVSAAYTHNSAAAASLEYQIAGGGHDAAVVAAYAGGGLVLPDDFLRHRIPGADELAHQLHLAPVLTP